MASTNKYDRQLRLWGRNGQKALVESKLLLLGASCTGSETLKNLVLPGCGSITIVDDYIVDEKDVSSNFFTRTQDIGRPRSEVVKEMMCEMNPDTKSSEHVVQSSADFIVAQNGDFTQYSLVIATQLPSSTLRELGNACTTSNVPMLVVRTYGLIGYVRVVLPRHDHPIVQDHKTNDTSDQWITNPWENLTNWRNSFNLDTQNSIEHMHTPWPVILHHILGKYKEEFGEEKYIALNRKTLGDYVMQFSMNHRMKLYEAEMKKTNSPSSDSNDDEHDTAPEDPRGAAPPLNYMEAKSRCYKALTNYELPYGLKDVLSDPRAGKNQESSTANINNPASGDKYMSFWIIMQAVNRFIEKEGNGFLPVTGTVVDLTASSSTYIAMQKQHQQKHVEDVNSVLAHVTNICTEYSIDMKGLECTPFADTLNDMIFVVIKHIREVTMTKTTTIEEEYTNTGKDSNGDTQPGQSLSEAFMMASFDSSKDKEMLGALWYIMMRSCDRYYIQHQSYPGSNINATEEELAAATKEVATHAANIQSELGYTWDFGYDKAAMEMVRYGASEVHTIAAYIGGVAGQEAVKILSHQYTPLNSTYIFNGINGHASNYTF